MGLYGRGVGDGGLEVGVPASEASVSEGHCVNKGMFERRGEEMSGEREANKARASQ